MPGLKSPLKYQRWKRHKAGCAGRGIPSRSWEKPGAECVFVLKPRFGTQHRIPARSQCWRSGWPRWVFSSALKTHENRCLAKATSHFRGNLPCPRARTYCGEPSGCLLDVMRPESWQFSPRLYTFLAGHPIHSSSLASTMKSSPLPTSSASCAAVGLVATHVGRNLSFDVLVIRQDFVAKPVSISHVRAHGFVLAQKFDDPPDKHPHAPLASSTPGSVLRFLFPC